MKNRAASLICVAALVCVSAGSAMAQEKPHVATKVADAVLVRPVCFASTAVGSALFALSLPVTAAIKKVKPTADALVVRPANATFKRPLGDMDAMAD